MNRVIKVLPLFLFILTGGLTARAEEASNLEKGVLEAVPEKGIRLSEKAIATLEIKTTSLNGNSDHKVPTGALVFYQDNVGVYRLRGGWYKLIPITLENKSSQSSMIRSMELKSGDQIVVQGVALLRVADMDAFGGEE